MPAPLRSTRQMVSLRSLRLPAGASHLGAHHFRAPDSTSSFAVWRKTAGLRRRGRALSRLYGPYRASNSRQFPNKGADYASMPSLVLTRMIQSAFGVLDRARVIAVGTGVDPLGKSCEGQDSGTLPPANCRPTATGYPERSLGSLIWSYRHALHEPPSVGRTSSISNGFKRLSTVPEKNVG